MSASTVLIPVFVSESPQRDIFKKLTLLADLIESILQENPEKDVVSRVLHTLTDLKNTEGLEEDFSGLVSVWAELIDLIPLLVPVTGQQPVTDHHTGINIFNKVTLRSIEQTKRVQVSSIKHHRALLQEINQLQKELFCTEKELRHYMAKSCAVMRISAKSSVELENKNLLSLTERVETLRVNKSAKIQQLNQLAAEEEKCRDDLLKWSTGMTEDCEKKLEDLLSAIIKFFLSITIPVDISDALVTPIARIKILDRTHRLYKSICTEYAVNPPKIYDSFNIEDHVACDSFIGEETEGPGENHRHSICANADQKKQHQTL